MTPEEMEYRRSARRDTDRMLVGVMLFIMIGGVFAFTLGNLNQLEDTNRDIALMILGAVIPILTLVSQFFFRTSGDKK